MDDDIKFVLALVLTFGGGIALGYLMAPKGVAYSQPQYSELYTPTCEELEE
jgi:hypothetical protein